MAGIAIVVTVRGGLVESVYASDPGAIGGFVVADFDVQDEPGEGSPTDRITGGYSDGSICQLESFEVDPLESDPGLLAAYRRMEKETQAFVESISGTGAPAEAATPRVTGALTAGKGPLPDRIVEAMETPGAVLEYRTTGGRVLVATVTYAPGGLRLGKGSSGLFPAYPYTVKLEVGPARVRRVMRYPELARARYECERLLEEWAAPGPWNREAWTPAARLHGSGAVTG